MNQHETIHWSRALFFAPNIKTNYWRAKKYGISYEVTTKQKRIRIIHGSHIHHFS